VCPDPPKLAITLSFLKVLDITMTGRLLMTPLVAKLAADVEAHYFSMFGIVFRLDIPNSLYELEEDSYLRYEV